MSFWKKEIYNRVKNFKKLVILCLGNPEASDDGVGVEIGKRLLENLFDSPDVFIFNCYTAAENFTSPVKKIMPSHILIIDSCVAGKVPGTVSVFCPDELKQVDISSHRIPVQLLSRYLKNETGADVIIIGIEPEILGKGRHLSGSVKNAADEIVEFLLKIFRKNW